MNTLSKSKILYLFIFLAAILLLLVFTRLFLARQPQQEQQPQPVLQFQPATENIQVVSIKPDKTTSLQPGILQQFLIQFAHSVNLGSIKLDVTRVDVTSNSQPFQVDKEILLSPDGKNLTVSLKTPTLSYSKYDLLLTDIKKGTIVFQASYLSDREQPAQIKTNNLELSKYLPYETSSFKLSYDKNRNIYIFNFKYRPESPDDLQTQYEKAKSEAIKFIESRAIDINTIVIEWRYS